MSARTGCLGSVAFFYYYFSMAAQLHVRQTRHWCRLIFYLVSEILALGRHAERLKWRGMIHLSRASVRPTFCRNAIDGTKTRRRRICISMRLRPFGWLPRRSTANTETLPIPFNFRLLRVHIAVWPIESLLAAIVPHNVEKMSGPWSSWFVHLITKILHAMSWPSDPHYSLENSILYLTQF